MYNILTIASTAGQYVEKLYREEILRVLITKKKFFLFVNCTCMTRRMLTKLTAVIISQHM